MASQPSPSRQHKHLTVLIDVGNASVAIANSLIETNETVGKLRAVLSIYVLTNCLEYEPPQILNN